MKAVITGAVIFVVGWAIPQTANAINALIRSAALSFATASNLGDVNVGLVKLIAALVLWIGVLLLIRKRD